MLDVALSLLALIAGGLSVELFAAAWAPLSCQDERGIPLETPLPQAVEELQIGNPS